MALQSKNTTFPLYMWDRIFKSHESSLHLEPWLLCEPYTASSRGIDIQLEFEAAKAIADTEA